MNQEISVWTLKNINEGEKHIATFSVSEDDMRLFARLSKDENPLHCDDEFAKKKGFAAKIVYGGILVSKISFIIGMKLPGLYGIWNSLNIQFVKPLYIDEIATCETVVKHVSKAAATIVLKIEIRSTAGIVSKAVAEVTLRE